ncbi:MAG TPA: MFS transporter [Verrucomicrobiae bacterium]|jgi:ACS family hexuronate transporter-like MFS transporter
MERVRTTPRVHSALWKWWICGLLLLASAINYMDRQTLANAAVRITTQFQLNQEQYGNLELVFGWAFALGSTVFGIAVDRLPVRWLYPVVLALWSVVGFATGLVNSYSGLLLCRGLLGLFEGGHWPCAIKTTQRLLAPQDRAMGNSVLQSGASIGAIVTPLIMSAMLTSQLSSWRMPFQVVGAAGLAWVILWFVMVRKGDLAPRTHPSPPVGERGPQPEREAPTSQPSPLLRAGERVAEGWVRERFPGSRSEYLRGILSSDLWRVFLGRRMLVMCFVVALINTSWQLLRAWLPKFLQQGRGYAETEALHFNALYYVATDVGCLGAGALTLWLARRGLSVHGSRSVVFLGCAAMSALTIVVALLPRGWPLLAALLLVGAGTLGLFPIYHALTQELSADHQGKVTGLTGVAAWLFSSPAQKLFGRLIDRTGSFDLGLAIVGCLPLLAFLALWLFWDRAPRGAPRAQRMQQG